MKKDLFFILALGLILAISIPLFNPGKGEQDFLGYWSAARLLVSGGNPYDTDEMVALQAATSPQRFESGEGLVNAWNPPWLILLLVPVALLPYPLAVPVWVLINTLLIGLALLLAWRLKMGARQSRGILVVFLAGFLFGETLSYLAIGQVTSLVLLGIVLVVWCLEHNRDTLAGVFLLAATIKPHIAYFFILIVLVWVLQNRRWKVLAGLISATLASLLVFSIVYPDWLSDYMHLIDAIPYNLMYTSTLGSFVTARTGVSWFNYSALALVLLVKPLLQVIRRDGWLTAANLALLISVPLSPFGFNFDQIVILPALAEMVAWVSIYNTRLKTLLLLAAAWIAMDILLIRMVMLPGLEHYWFFWIPLAVLGIYLVLWRHSQAAVTAQAEG